LWIAFSIFFSIFQKEQEIARVVITVKDTSDFVSAAGMVIESEQCVVFLRAKVQHKQTKTAAIITIIIIAHNSPDAHHDLCCNYH